MEKLNIDKVAKLAHVSRSVVSRVLNNHANVSDVARERVMKVVRKYNYRPNSVARSLATNSTHEIGVLVTQSEDEALGNAFWMQMHRGIFEESRQRGYFVSLSYVSKSNSKELYNFIINERRLAGLKAKFHVDGVSLGCPDEVAIMRDREPALLVAFDER